MLKPARQVTCEKCKGSGKVKGRECRECKGTGKTFTKGYLTRVHHAN